MKTPSSNFFKNVFNHKDTKVIKQIHKPENEIKEDRKEIVIPKKVTKTYRQPPLFDNQLLMKLHQKRRIKNRMQSHSRILNRAY